MATDLARFCQINNSQSHYRDVMNTQITRAAINSADGDLAHNAIDTHITGEKAVSVYLL